MPLPDAKPDRRIYELLKTTDLENLTFAQFQAVAETVYAEQGAEDTLRRIVLVNLARLAVVGEWTGLTNAGGGSEWLPTLMIDDDAADQDYVVSAMTPYGAQGASSQSMTFDEPYFFPIISPVTGTVSRMSIKVNGTASGENVLVGVYSEDETWYGPKTLLGYATFDLSSSGDQSQTSFSASISMTAGTKYWIGYVCDTASSSASVWGLNNNYTPQFGGATSSVTGTRTSWRLISGLSDQALPSSVADATKGYLDTGKRLALGMKW
jgi:hypothetical protein